MTKSIAEQARKYLGQVQQLIASDRLTAAAYARSVASSVGEKRAIVGLNATFGDMCTPGTKGSYFTIDEEGQIREHHFVQGTEGNSFQETDELTIDDFLEKTGSLPKDNMANLSRVVPKLMEYIQKSS